MAGLKNTSSFTKNFSFFLCFITPSVCFASEGNATVSIAPQIQSVFQSVVVINVRGYLKGEANRNNSLSSRQLGFFIDEEGTILASSHTTFQNNPGEYETEYTATLHTGKTYAARVIVSGAKDSEKPDAALFKLIYGEEELVITPVRLSPLPKKNNVVYGIRITPQSKREVRELKTGIVLNPEERFSDRKYPLIKTSIYLEHGDSGGPLITEDGTVAGIAIAYEYKETAEKIRIRTGNNYFLSIQIALDAFADELKSHPE